MNRRWSWWWTRPRRWWIKLLLFPKLRRCLTWRVIWRWRRRLLGQGLWRIFKNWLLRFPLFGYDRTTNFVSTGWIFVSSNNSLWNRCYFRTLWCWWRFTLTWRSLTRICCFKTSGLFTEPRSGTCRIWSSSYTCWRWWSVRRTISFGDFRMTRPSWCAGCSSTLWWSSSRLLCWSAWCSSPLVKINTPMCWRWTNQCEELIFYVRLIWVQFVWSTPTGEVVRICCIFFVISCNVLLV